MTFDKRVAFADANFTQKDKSEKRGSMTDRGMVFVLMGPPTYGGRAPAQAGRGHRAERRHVVGGRPRFARRPEAGQAVGRATVDAPSSTQQRSTTSTPARAPRPPESNYDFQEVWHYRKELLPKGVGYLQVDATFITKKGYGMYVLQRDSDILTTLSAAKEKPE